jgi:hypothetical protein
MNRKRLAVVTVIAAGGLLAGLLLAQDGHSNPAVAHVNDQTITRDQLAAVVEHFRKEYEAEGKPFPGEKSANFRALQNRLLGLLVYRAELSQAARRLGIRVMHIQVLRAMNAGSQGEEQNTDAFQFDTVKAQLLYERIYANVTEGISAPTTAQLSARRNAAMSSYIDKLKRETKVRYEPGYAPGP